MVGDIVTWFDPSRRIGTAPTVAGSEASHAIDVWTP